MRHFYKIMPSLVTLDLSIIIDMMVVHITEKKDDKKKKVSPKTKMKSRQTPKKPKVASRMV